MIKASLSGIKIEADFTFFAVVAMFLTLDTTGFAIMSLIVCGVHEAGHLLAMLLIKQKPDSITLRGGGIRISSGINPDRSILVILSGSLINIVLFSVLYFSLPKTDIKPVMFAVLNLVIGLFNLLPFGCLDGKRLLKRLGFFDEKTLRIIETVILIAVITAITSLFLKGGINFTFIAAIIYVMAVDIFSKV